MKIASMKITRRQLATGLTSAVVLVGTGCAVSTGSEEPVDSTVENINELRSVSDVRSGMRVEVLGYRHAGDGGGGVFEYEPRLDKEIDDLGYVLRSVHAGQWRRIVGSSDVAVQWFGAIGDGASRDTEAVLAAAVVAAKLDRRVVVPSGLYRVDGLGKEIAVADIAFISDDAINAKLIEQVTESGLDINYYPSSYD